MKIFKSIILGLGLIVCSGFILASEEITPYKFNDSKIDIPSYKIPQSSRFTTKRLEKNAANIVYYFSKPSAVQYPIAILCGGSSNEDDIVSIIHVHRYFLQELRDLGVGVLTVEQWGVDGNKVNKKAFMNHYTRSQRLADHKTVIEHLTLNPPKGWNGKFIFFGVSEGGPLVTTLTENYSGVTLATMNWVGAGDWPWREELWAFLQKLVSQNPAATQAIKCNYCDTCVGKLTLRESYDACMDTTIKHPKSDQYFLGMTYKYHADAMQYLMPDYSKIRTPFLVVSGAQDSFIASSDAFVKKAKDAGVNITYLRVVDMDHYVRKRLDIVKKSFKWLTDQINAQ